MITYLGEVSLGDLQPTLASASADLSANANANLDGLNAQLDGLIEAQAQVQANPPSLASSLSTIQEMLAQVQAAIAAGVPDVDAGALLAEISAGIGSLQSKIGDLEASISASAGINAQLAATGFAGWVYAGTAGSFASELGGETNGGILGGNSAQQINAVVIATATPVSWAALQEIFGL